MIYIYRFFSTLLYPILIVLIFFRKFLNKEDKIRFKEKIFSSTFSKSFEDQEKLIWFHAASIGEVQSIIPIIEKLNSNKIKYNFLITTTTFSSGKFFEEKLKKYSNITHRYLPLDVNFLVRKFISIWKPYAVILVDSEIWPNLILNLREKKIPISIINGRLTYRTFKRWMAIRNTSLKIFGIFDLILASNLKSKEYFEKLGGKDIFYFGNIKFAQKLDIKKIVNINEDILKTRNYWCAVSTHNNEEKYCIETHIEIKKKLKNVLTIIIPRHIDRSQEIKKISLGYKLNTQIINKNDLILNNTEILIVNSFGILPQYLKHAKSVFIGKSMLAKLKNDGGQNPILAAQLGCKIYHGPYVFNFEDIYQFLKEKNITRQISSINELTNNILNDFKIIKNNSLKSQQLIEKIGDSILEETTKKIGNFLNYENQ